ncbi:mucin-1-like [Chrysemys picta bellii]|uniref:mucin-1-like n=1 Tax=Chrysemys picta bellii TaxID=8478 RepID=UPI0032B2DFF9
MTRFLEEHGPFPITGDGAPRAIFNNRFTSFLKTEPCAGGYGLSLQLEMCPDCCILCQPGTFSAPGSNECTTCPVGTFNPLYGRTACSRCKEGLVTRATGATSTGDCVEEKVPVPLRIPVMVLIILLPPIGCSCLIILGCFWCHRCRQKRRMPPWAFGGTAVTATAAHAPEAPYATSPPHAATAASETVPPAMSASAGAGLEDTPRGLYTTGAPYTAAPGSKTTSLASSPSAGAGKITPRGPYAAAAPGAAASSETIPLGATASALAGLQDTPRPTYSAGAPGTAAPASKTVSLASSPAAGVGTPRASYTAGAPGAAASSETLPLGASASALAGLQDTPRPTYAAGAPGTAAPASKTISLASSPSAGAVKGTRRASYTAGAPGAAAASGSTGASVEDLPPAPSPAEEVSSGEFVFPSPPVFSPAGSNGNMRRPS